MDFPISLYISCPVLNVTFSRALLASLLICTCALEDLILHIIQYLVCAVDAFFLLRALNLGVTAYLLLCLNI